MCRVWDGVVVMARFWGRFWGTGPGVVVMVVVVDDIFLSSFLFFSFLVGWDCVNVEWWIVVSLRR